MAKPTIVTRAGKGSALTWTEGDTNLTNLRDATVTIKAGTGGTDVVSDLNGTVTLVAGTNVTISGDNTAKTVTINASGTGGGLTDIVQDTTPQLGGDLDVNGNSIVSASNGNIAITPNGTGSVVIDGNAMPQDQGTADQVLITDGAGQTSWSEVKTVYSLVYNAEATTISKGQPVYLFSATGANPSVKLALNTSDTTSAKTYGLAAENITAGSTGRVVIQGVLKNIDTGSYSAGDTLYLGSTAGSMTTTKPYAPNHLVYLGVVTTVNSTSGRIIVRVQNGYELDEIHDVNINHNVSLANKDYLVYNSSNSLWENRQLDIVNDTTPQLGGNLDVNGNSIVSTSNGNITLAPNGTGKVIISGDLQVGGTTTTINATNLDVADLNITVAKGSANAAAANGAGLTVDGANATLTYDSTNDRWAMNKSLATNLVGNVTGNVSGNAGTVTNGVYTTDTGTVTNTMLAGSIANNKLANSSITINGSAISLGGSTSVGTVTSVSGTGTVSGLSLSGSVTSSGSLTLGGTLDLSSPPAIGGTTPSTGAFSTLSATTTGTSQALSITYNPTSTSGVAILATGKDSQGGTGYFDFLKTTNTTSGATNPNKTFRMNSTGNIEIINSAYTTNIFNLSDAGVLTIPSLISNGAITFKDTREAIYDLGTTGGTVAPNPANGSVQKITLNSALTINGFTSPQAGQSLTLIIYGGTAYTSITSTMKFAGGVKTLTGTAGCIDILTVYYDGTTYFASLGKGYA